MGHIDRRGYRVDTNPSSADLQVSIYAKQDWQPERLALQI